MKYFITATACLMAFAACQSKAEKEKEEKVINEKVEERVKTDKEKGDSVRRYYDSLIKANGNSTPEMPE